MADQKITALNELLAPEGADLLVVVDDPGGLPETKKLTLENLGALYLAQFAGGRLTLVNGNPAPATDATGATLYYTAYTGNRIALYDGSRWKLAAFSTRSISLAGCAANTNYDVFLYDNSGTPTLELLAWASSVGGASARATALARQDGVWVKSGSPTRRYLGTIRTTSAGQCEDSQARRFVWNAENRLLRHGYVYVGSSSSHTYASTTVRAYNNDPAIAVEYVRGLAEEPALLAVLSDAQSNSALGYGYNSPTEQAANVLNLSTARLRVSGRFAYPDVEGYHKVFVTECAVSGTATFQTAALLIELRG